jgi:hypothetical protein
MVKEEEEVTYIVQGGDYEIAFHTVLRFANGSEPPVRAGFSPSDITMMVLLGGKRAHPSRFRGAVGSGGSYTRRYRLHSPPRSAC